MHLWSRPLVRCVLLALALGVVPPRRCIILGRNRAHPFGHTAHMRYPAKPRDTTGKAQWSPTVDGRKMDPNNEMPLTDDPAAHDRRGQHSDTLKYYRNSYGAHMGRLFKDNSRYDPDNYAHIEEPYIEVYHKPSQPKAKKRKNRKNKKDYPEMSTADFQRVRNVLKQDELMPVSLHAVPFDVFQEKIQSVRTYHDVLRIFYGNHVLTNDIIDSVMENNAEPYNTPYGTMVGFSPVRRPRIGDRDSDYYSTVFHTRYVGEGTDKHHVLVHDSHYSPSSSSVMSTSKGSAASDIMLSDGAAAAPARRADHKTRTASAAHHHKSRRRRRKSKGRGRKRKKGKGRKRYKKELAAATAHLKQMEMRGECRDPTPVVVSIRDYTTAADKEYYPHCTTLYKCRADSGCCRDAAFVCGVKRSEKIKRSFFVVTFGKAHMVSFNGVESFTFENHTECACEPLEQLPECKPCPDPFFLRRENTTDCSCECFDGDSRCVRIKKGRQPLEEDALKCIKEDKCQRPRCRFGPFTEESVRTGLCPRQEDMTSGLVDVDLKSRSRRHGLT